MVGLPLLRSSNRRDSFLICAKQPQMETRVRNSIIAIQLAWLKRRDSIWSSMFLLLCSVDSSCSLALLSIGLGRDVPRLWDGKPFYLRIIQNNSCIAATLFIYLDLESCIYDLILHSQITGL